MDMNTPNVISFSCVEVEEDGNSAVSGGHCSKGEMDLDSTATVSVCSADKSSAEVATDVRNEDGSVEESNGSSQDEVEDGCIEWKKGPCTYCGQIPCDWVAFETEICEECEELVEQNCTNKEVRFHAYHLYTRLRHGVLRKFDRRPSPMCSG
jgi:hypothetical protein